MTVLHVDLRLASGREPDLLDVYRDTFRPAISRQPGFRSVDLLRPNGGELHRLVIVFDEEEQRTRWVASEVHQRVWPQIEALCAGYTPNLFVEVP